MLPTLLGVGVLVFVMRRGMPGDVVELKLRGDGTAVSEETIAAERAKLGLDRPIVVQFFDWMGDLLRLDLGRSMWTGEPVVDEIGARLWVSLEVAFMATVIAVVIALPLGTLSALYRDSWIDYLVRILAVAGL